MSNGESEAAGKIHREYSLAQNIAPDKYLRTLPRFKFTYIKVLNQL